MDEEQDECPKGGKHGWRYDSHLDGQVVLYCWKCGEETLASDE